MQTYRIEGLDEFGRPKVEFVHAYAPLPPLYFWLGRDGEKWHEVDRIECASEPKYMHRYKPLSFRAWMLQWHRT